MNHKVIIGLETHVELKTNSKMFCRCSIDYFGQQPNTHTCPVCLGLPGALPYPNKKAIGWCVMIGLALNCKILSHSKFDRKNYFYPDLPKGYQISQYDLPFCINGKVIININGKEKEIRVRRVHMEEDTGKLIHQTIDGNSVSLIDFNRSGVPLVEIVTEPDFENGLEVKQYLHKLQQIVRYLDVSNADMEKGQMRLEPNISISLNVNSNELPKYKVEVKNINSFSFVEKAINFEIKRQLEILEKRQTPVQETRGWDDKKNATVSQRIKEEANDYRYFPEPDIPPVEWRDDDIELLRQDLPELPDEKLIRFRNEYQLSEYDNKILTKEKEFSDFFEETVLKSKLLNKSEDIPSPKQIANYIINKKVDFKKMTPSQLVHTIQSSLVLSTVSDDEIKNVIKIILKDNPGISEDYAKGKENVIQFAIGQVMYRIKKRIDVNLVRKLILEGLK